MQITQNNLYLEDVQRVSNNRLPWDMLVNKTLLVTGATGLLGRFLVDVIMNKNVIDDLNCTIIAVSRNEARAMKEFGNYWNLDTFRFIAHDINEPMNSMNIGKVDFVIHMASNTHPRMYATDPIGTITANIIGTMNLLDFCVSHKVSRFAFASSNEIYGENRGDVNLFREDYCGYINSNTLRAGYPESKRCGEALCQAYYVQKKVDVVVPRFTRSYGPNMLSTDSKAISQFIINGINGEDIVLKSEGLQNYSYTYMADAISGLLYVLFLGKSGEAYNIADVRSNITLRELAGIIAKNAKTRLSFEQPDGLEKTGFSKATKALLDGSKLNRLGWNAHYDIQSGIARTMNIFKDINKYLNYSPETPKSPSNT